MKRPFLMAGVVAVVIIIVWLALFQDVSEKVSTDPSSAAVVANSFPAPLGATTAFPDSVTNGIATKGWRASGTIADACVSWREAYRGWVDPGEAGSITGSDEDGRRCTLSGPKSGYIADLAVTVYGEDPTPSVILSVRKQ